MKKISIALTGVLSAFAPALAFAQNPGVQDILDNQISPLLNSIIPLLITVGVIYFIWGIVQYVIADNEESKEKGKGKMMWGLVGLFVIVTFWGLIQVIQTSTDTENVDPDTLLQDIVPFQ